MKRIFLIALLLVPFYMVSNAQIKFGVKAGLTSTSIKADDVINVSNQTEFDQLIVKGKSANVGFQGGLMGRITIVKMYVQPELLFSSTSGDVEITAIDGANVTTQVREQKFRQLDFPIMVGFKFGPARIQAGPVGSIMLSSDPALDMFNNVDVEEEFNGASWGYQVGVGLDIGKKLTLDLKYEGNLSKVADGVNIGDQNYSFDSRNNQFVANVGIFF